MPSLLHRTMHTGQVPGPDHSRAHPWGQDFDGLPIILIFLATNLTSRLVLGNAAS